MQQPPIFSFLWAHSVCVLVHVPVLCARALGSHVGNVSSSEHGARGPSCIQCANLTNLSGFDPTIVSAAFNAPTSH